MLFSFPKPNPSDLQIKHVKSLEGLKFLSHYSLPMQISICMQFTRKMHRLITFQRTCYCL